MLLEIEFHKGASKDTEDSFVWYENQKTGLGLRFLVCIEVALSIIKDNPLLFAVTYKDFRRAPVEVFPFSIYYKIKGDAIIIVGIMHQKRNYKVLAKRR